MNSNNIKSKIIQIADKGLNYAKNIYATIKLWFNFL